MTDKVIIKILVLSVICFSSVLCVSEEMQELMNMLHQTCVGETGVSEGLIEDVRKGTFAEDNSLKCYMKCIMDQTGTIDDDGIIDVEGVLALLPDEFKDNVADAIRSCGTVKGSDPCDNAFLTNKCYYDKAPNYYMLV